MARAFAGPLCRFYAGHDGEPLTFVAGVEAWHRDLIEALGPRLRAELAWREDPAASGHETDLGEAGWPALRLFALYAERAELELPDTVPALLELDRTWRAASEQKFAASRYGNLLACRLWLPADFAITFRAPLPDGEPAEIGSLPVLVAQLGWLNQRTFAADDEEIARWRALPAPAGGSLLAAAQRGFAGLWDAAGLARQWGLPLVVREP
jgi:hypothetical protein